MERYLVTGGAGFIGSHIVEALLAENHYVRVLDNFDTGNPDNLPPASSNLDIQRGSIEDLETVRAAMQGIDYVLHQAARASVPRSISDPLGTHNTNVTGTLYVLLAAKEVGVRRVVCASSSAIYGDLPGLPKDESMLPAPMSPYAISKIVNEYYARVFYENYGTETVALRYFNIYGSRQNPDLQYAAVIPIFIRNMLLGKPCVIYGDGEQTRDFIYVKDCVQANLKSCKASGVSGGVFNIAQNRQTSVNQLFSILSEILSYRIPPIYEEPRVGDIKHSYADNSRARAQLGFAPETDLQEGLQQTVAWYRKRLKD
jgi:UDP-glucose 4-epimerase